MKIIDWQFLSCTPPWIDFGCIAYYNCHPDLVEQNLDKFYNVYYGTFCRSCQIFGVEPPFSREEFIRQNEKLGFAVCLVFMIFFYDPVGRESNMHLRVLWMIKMCMKYSPQIFQ